MFAGIDHNYSFGGIKVIVSNQLPTKVSSIKLSDSVDVSSQFRSEFNQWLNQKFCKLVHSYIVSGNNLIVSQEAYNQLEKKVIRRSNGYIYRRKC